MTHPIIRKNDSISFINSVNFFPLRILFHLHLDPNWNFAELLLQIAQISNDQERHVHVEQSATYYHKSILNRTVLFPVLFDFGNALSKRSLFDLSLTIDHNEYLNTIQCHIDTSSHLFDQTTTEQLSQRFHLLTQQLLSSDHHQQPIYAFSIILPDEHMLLERFYPRTDEISIRQSTTTIPQLFLEQVMKHSDKLAVTLDDVSLTYSELLTRVKQLAFGLKSKHDIEIGDIICQCMDRSIDMIVGILAIMMAGGIYVPLNPSDASVRLQSCIDQIKPKLVLTNTRSTKQKVNARFVDLNEIVQDDDKEDVFDVSAIQSDSLSHIIFTSGSTGVPKGVAIRHRNFVSYMRTHQFDETDVILQLASCSFDVHIDEIVSSLCRGAHLVLVRSGSHLDFDYLTKVIFDRRVTFIAPVPSWIDALCQYLSKNTYANQRLKSVRWWFIGGEQLFSSTIQQLLPFVHAQCHLLNTYGPAEITETATSYRVPCDRLSQMISIPIGYPLSGYHVYLLDQYQQPVMPNQQGEIVIGGK